MRLRTMLLAAAGVGGLLACANQAVAQDLGHSVSEVVITASPLAGDPDRFATIVEQVSRDQVLSNGGASLADALRNVPGVAGTGFAAGASRPVIRGMDAQRVKLAENGLSSSDVSDVGPDHGVPIDPLAAQQIEVVRGAATLRYGSQAIGGVVNVINNRIPLKPIDGIEGETTAAYSTSSSTGEGTVSLDAGQGPFAVHLDGFGRRASSYDTPDGVQPNSFFRGNGYSGGASYFFGDDSRIGASGTHYEARYGIPSDDTFIRMKQDKGAVGGSFKFSQGLLQRINVDAGYADYTHSEIDPETNAVLSTFNNKEWDGRMEALFGATGPLSASALGVQFQDRKFSALGEGADYLLPTHTQSVAAFAFVEAPVGALQFQGAARVEHIKIDGTPTTGIETSRDFTPFSLSAGFTYDASDALRLGLTVASAARAPAQTELFARGPHDGPATFETGDPELKIERANSLEATARYKLGSEGRIEASAWAAHFDNYIYGALTGRLCDESGVCEAGGELKELNYGQRDANFWGLEAKAFFPLASVGGGKLSGQVLGDYVRAKFTGAGGDVPRIQPGRFGGGLDWDNDVVDASFLVLAVSSQDHVGVADLATDGYTSVDAQVRWKPFKAKPGIALTLVGHNLADETIRNATALNKDSVLMPGRDVRLVLSAKF
ncbi:iron complex outermembrane receptor protein [Caulobacter rhizosphaerae]|uniref:Iron complex outermembrane receptor protein n=1 Tax=Caulobacter rhizosphaerae TaxID=2010972 RepID=A0ABU1N2X6_9CAUL|nr:TonB-dependent receptor [Caulobacter rhizosphaerae]MDR6532808.1 iron complex outermembrane receptor protein [Caulobacter rhizosphaerae]